MEGGPIAGLGRLSRQGVGVDLAPELRLAGVNAAWPPSSLVNASTFSWKARNM
jgi:hypothetical protein